MTSSTFLSDTSSDQTTSGHRAVRLWLYFLCAMVFAMVVVGGATRLTDSGLSITEWKPIVGIVPPLSDADWQDAFQKYKQIPEYEQINKGMSLDEFKGIFWWEWAHRFLGRMIGFAFLIPFILLWFFGKIERRLVPRLIGLFLLGGLQGALGWFMVKSGLVDRVDVSQYRLAAHLGLAFIIFAAIFWVALGLRDRRGISALPGNSLRTSACVLTVLIFLQVILGAFVAGTDAGLSHNTWPLMDGAIIPDGLFAMEPWYANLFENVATIQFNHRMFAYLVILYAVVHFVFSLRKQDTATYRLSAAVVAGALIVQAALGIWTLLAVVPISLGVIHQGGALIVFATALYHLHSVCAGERSAP